MARKQKIGLITTGGTIAMALAGDSIENEINFTSSELLNAVPQMRLICDVKAVDLFSKPSSSLLLEDIKKLYETILDLSKTVDGIVITHGTDTLEETAFALSLLLDIKIPVVITGALRKPDCLSSDGALNLLNAAQVAISENANGVLVVMNGQIMSGFFAKKSHSFLPHAFSNNPIGWIAEDRVRIFFKPIFPRQSISIGSKESKILTIECGINTKPCDFDAIDYKKLDALVINAAGVGHVSCELVDKLAQIAARIPTIFASRVGDGETFSNYYRYEGSEMDLISKGLIPSGFLNSVQSRVLLMLAFSCKKLSTDYAKKLLSGFNS